MGFLKGRIEDYSSPLAGLPARLYAGYFFLKYGLHKVTSGFDGPALQKTLGAWAAESRYSFYIPFMTKIAMPHAGLFAYTVAFGELAVGVALLAGATTRLAALAGMLMCLNFLFASGAPIISTEQPVVFILVLLTVYLTAAGRALGLDSFLKSRLPRWVS